jgi:resuscitation-promoting factor RpfA
MSTSRDIKALFDRFGGDATSYREIRMENEAHDARDRWPLLGMIDPRKVELSAAEQARGQKPANTVADAGASATPGESEAAQSEVGPASMRTGGLLPRDRSQAALRRSAPLFTRSPRRDIPPVIEKAAPKAPESAAFRFSPTPGAAPRGDDESGGQVTQPDMPAAASDASAPDPVAETSFPGPRIAPRAAALAPLAVNVARAAPAVPAVPTASAPVVPAALVASRETQPLAAAPRSSPLKKLFGSAAPAPAASGAAAPQVAATDDRLDHLFDRLRGGSQPARVQTGSVEPTAVETKAKGSGRPWFLKGVGKP